MSRKEKLIISLAMGFLVIMVLGVIRSCENVRSFHHDEDEGERAELPAGKSASPSKYAMALPPVPKSVFDGGRGRGRGRGIQSLDDDGNSYKKSDSFFSKKIKFNLNQKNPSIFDHKIREKALERKRLINDYYEVAKSNPENIFRQDKENYVLFTQLSGIPSSQVEDLNPIYIIEKKMGYTILPKKYLDPSSPSTKVVYNPRTDKLGIVTGSYLLTLKDFSTFQDLLRDFPDFKVLGKFEAIATVVLGTPHGYNMILGLTELQKHPLVKEAKIEVLEDEYVSQ